MTNAHKTHCPQGHEYTPENTVYRAKYRARRCVLCHRAHSKAYMARRRKGRAVTVGPVAWSVPPKPAGPRRVVRWPVVQTVSAYEAVGRSRPGAQSRKDTVRVTDTLIRHDCEQAEALMAREMPVDAWAKP